MAELSDEIIHRAKQAPIEGMIQALDLRGLARAGGEWTGPCPICGGTDRFSINVRKGLFLCRLCESAGGRGDVIALVAFVKSCSFVQAVTWICGPQEGLTPAEQRARDAAMAAQAAEKAKDAAAFRARAMAEARRIWQEARPAEGSLVRHYLALRGFAPGLLPVLPPALRFQPDLAYMVQNPENDRWICAHRGPAMIAAIQGPDARLCAVHRTWFDPEAPLGKIAVHHPVTGALMPRKKVQGSKKGGAIRLSRGFDETLVMGEGIETTLSAQVSGAYPGAMFWAGVDLGNMAGRRQSGPGLKFAGLPEIEDDEAFVPPAGVTRLIYIQDGDSEPRETRAKLEAGLRRAMIKRPGLRGQIAAAPQGFDLNDVLLCPGADAAAPDPAGPQA